MMFRVDTSTPHFCIGDKELERIFLHSIRKSIPIIHPKYEPKFNDKLIRSGAMFELILSPPVSTHDISVIFDVIDIEIPALLVLNVRDFRNGNSSLVACLINKLWNQIITNKDPFRFEDI